MTRSKKGDALLVMIQNVVPEFLPTHSVCNSAEVATPSQRQSAAEVSSVL